MKNIKATKKGLIEKSSGRKIESPLDVKSVRDIKRMPMFVISIWDEPDENTKRKVQSIEIFMDGTVTGLKLGKNQVLRVCNHYRPYICSCPGWFDERLFCSPAKQESIEPYRQCKLSGGGQGSCKMSCSIRKEKNVNQYMSENKGYNRSQVGHENTLRWFCRPSGISLIGCRNKFQTRFVKLSIHLCLRRHEESFCSTNLTYEPSIMGLILALNYKHTHNQLLSSYRTLAKSCDLVNYY